MAPTGPVNGPKPGNKGIGNRAVRQTPKETGRTDRATNNEAAGRTATQASSLAAHQKVLGSAREEARQVDERMIMELRQAIADGSFKVDPYALAESILGDVAGYDELSKSDSSADDIGSADGDDYEGKGS